MNLQLTLVFWMVLAFTPPRNSIYGHGTQTYVKLSSIHSKRQITP